MSSSILPSKSEDMIAASPDPARWVVRRTDTPRRRPDERGTRRWPGHHPYRMTETCVRGHFRETLREATRAPDPCGVDRADEMKALTDVRLRLQEHFPELD